MTTGAERQLSHLQGSFVVLAAGVIFSFGPLIFRAVEEATDWQFLAVRAWSAGIVTGGILFARHRGATAMVIRNAGPRIWVAGVLIGGAFACFVLSIARITVATILLLQAASPFVAALVGWLLLGEAVRGATWLVMGIAGAGIFVMIGGNVGGADRVGLLLAALIPLLLGVYSVLVRSALASDPMVPVVIAGLLAGTVAAVVALGGPGLDLTQRDLFMAWLSGGVALGIGLPLFNYGHRFVPAAEVTLLLMTEIVLAPIWVWIWPGETPTTATLLGGALILGSLVGLVLISQGRQGLPATYERS